MKSAAINCPSCNKTFSLSPAIENHRQSLKQCIGCHSQIDGNAVICISCGINQQNGTQVQTKLSLRKSEPETKEPSINPILARYSNPMDDEPTFMDKVIPLLKMGIGIAIVLCIGAFIFLKRDVISNILSKEYTRATTTPAPQAPPTTPTPTIHTSPFASSKTSSPIGSSTSSLPVVSGTLSETTNAMGQLEWGMSKSNVKEILKKQQEVMDSETTNTVIYKTSTLCDKACVIAYKFHNNCFDGKYVAFALPNRRDLIYFTSPDDYLAEYKDLQDKLKVKYGTFEEKRQDTDIGYAINQWEAKVNKQQDAVEYQQKTLDALRTKLMNESDMRGARRQDFFDHGGRMTKEDYTKENVDIKNAHTKKLERQQEYLADEKEKLNTLLNNKPVKGWESYISRYHADDCDIALTCARAPGGVRIILSYNSKDPKAATTVTDEL